MNDNIPVTLKQEEDNGEFLYLNLSENTRDDNALRMRVIHTGESTTLHCSVLHENTLRFFAELSPKECLHDEYETSLEDLIKKEKMEFFWTSEVYESKKLYKMSQKFLVIAKGILCGLMSRRKENRSVEALAPKDVVFSYTDRGFEVPKIKDCCTADDDGSRVSYNLRALADLILKIAIRHQLHIDFNTLYPNETHLRPDVLLFVQYLRLPRGEYQGEVFHPILLNGDEKTEYIVRVRDELRDGMLEFHIKLEDIHTWMQGTASLSKLQKAGWSAYCAGMMDPVIALTEPGTAEVTPNYGSAWQFITYLRNSYVHGNENREANPAAPTMEESDELLEEDKQAALTKEGFGELLDKNCPALLPLLFQNFGNLQERKEP